MILNRLLTIDDVATQLNVSSSTVRRWVRSGKLVGQKAGVQWRFDPDAVRKALDDGSLSGISRDPQASVSALQHASESAVPLIAQWREMLNTHLDRTQPDHVIVTDRRGAKIWSMIMPRTYIWGQNLWHSTIFKLLSVEELQRLFVNRRVLVFDEIMQRGRELHELKQTLESLGAEAMTVVCVRQRSHAEAGDLRDYDTYVFEDVDDVRFSERAAIVSRLISRFEPPLDVDHLLVRGTFKAGITGVDLLEKLAKWGMPILVWPPDNHHNVLAITLDRPQFFNTQDLDLPNSIDIQRFSFDWDGPCKVRLYLKPETGRCYCSFIIYPRIQGKESEWFELLGSNTRQTLDPIYTEASDNYKSLKRLYYVTCLQLAVKLFREFVVSGAARDIGIDFGTLSDAIDLTELKATFGEALAKSVSRQVKEVLTNSPVNEQLFPSPAPVSPAPLIRKEQTAVSYIHDLFQCRTDFLKAIPQRLPSGATDSALRPLSYRDLLYVLPNYPEATIGRILDYELDRGTAKPVVHIEVIRADDDPIIVVERGFFRGEFGPWFEFDTRELSDRDLIIQRTMALGPTVIEGFLKKTRWPKLIATHFNKVFANLQHDWRDAYDLLYLGWRPYKYGPVVVVPDAWGAGEFKAFDRFLIERRCLVETKESHGTRQWPRYQAAGDSEVPWRRLYQEKTAPVTRAHVKGLIRLYAAIQDKCQTARSTSSTSKGFSLFTDPLVVLASARNEDVTYKCGWFEVRDWIAQGENHLFPMVHTLALNRSAPTKPFLAHDLETFAAPARLLLDKLEMYRNLPYLRAQIDDLCAKDDHEVGEILLETIDVTPKFESDSARPVQNLEWACNIMRPFSSFVRQILTNCRYDVPTKKAKNATVYLEELFRACPELKTIETDLRHALDHSTKGLLTEEIANSLSKAFSLIVVLFQRPGKIPDPRPSFERERERLESRNGLIQALNGLREQLAEPYAIAVADIKNVEHLSNIAEILKIPTDEAMAGILGWVEKAAKEVASRHSDVIYGGMSSDNVIFAGRSCEQVVACTLELVKETFRKLKTVDYNQLAHFGLLRAGIAWCDGSKGQECHGVKPGLTAYRIGDMHGQPLGTVAITKQIHELLPATMREEFEEMSVQSDGRSVTLYRRLWVHDRDSV